MGGRILEEGQIIEADNGLVFKAQTVLGKKRVKEQQQQYRAKQKRDVVKSKKKASVNPDLKDKIINAEKFIMEKRALQKNFVNQKKRKFMELDQDFEGRTI